MIIAVSVDSTWHNMKKILLFLLFPALAFAQTKNLATGTGNQILVGRGANGADFWQDATNKAQISLAVSGSYVPISRFLGTGTLTVNGSGTIPASSAAFSVTSAFATAAQGALADSAIPNLNGTGTNISLVSGTASDITLSGTTRITGTIGSNVTVLPTGTSVKTITITGTHALLNVVSVQGAGLADFDGDYVLSGTYAGKPSYTKLTGAGAPYDILWFEPGEPSLPFWAIKDAGIQYYDDNESDVPYPWLVEGWSVAASGDPAPSVQQAIFDGIFFDSTAVICFRPEGATTNVYQLGVSEFISPSINLTGSNSYIGGTADFPVLVDYVQKYGADSSGFYLGGTASKMRLIPSGAGSVTITGTGSINASVLENVSSGTYTPTLTNVTNISASTPYECQYLRVGNVVTVSGKVDIDTTLAVGTASELGMSLPIASAFTAEENCGGTASSPAAASLVSAIRADATNDRAAMVFSAISLSNDSYFFEFSYLVK